MENIELEKETIKTKKMANHRVNTRQIAITGVLIALSFVMPYFMPTITLPFTTFTLFSHVPVITAMFISPFTAALASAGTALAFFLKTNPIVGLRAASHIFFTIPGAFAINKGLINKGWGIFLGLLITGLIHGAAEIVVVAAFLGASGKSFTLYYIMIEVGLITLAHHCIDYLVSIIAYQSCAKARLLENKFTFKN
jgi:niacin transporter